MKLILVAVLALSTSAFAEGKKTYQAEKVNYGTRSDGKVVPTSKEVRKTTVKPQMEEHDESKDMIRTKKTTTTKETTEE